MLRRIALGALIMAAVANAGEKFTFPNFQNRPHLNLNGDAMSEIGELVLTRAEKNQAGAVWFDKAVSVENGFFTSFSFSVKDVENQGGEGFAFVLQSAGPYSIGGSGNGIGYDGLGSGVAVEFDTVSDKALNDPEKPHISIHLGIGSQLSSTESGNSGWFAEVEDLAGYDEDPSVTFSQRRVITIEYNANRGAISVKESHRDKNGKFILNEIIKYAQVGAISGRYYVGFTATTGESFARFALGSWSFRSEDSNKNTGCSEGFDGSDCSMTNQVAEKECPRRTSCNVCVEDVYNCAWCIDGKGSCVVGVEENLKQCSSFALEPPSCTAGLSRIWLYLLGLSFIVVFAFGYILYRLLPVRQSFRAISLLVAFVGGALSGMFISYIISASLVEISETPFFAIAYGLFFLIQFLMIGAHVAKEEVPTRGFLDAHVILLLTCCLCALLSSIACFLLDRRLIHWLPEGPKVLFYTILGASLNFCLVFSIAELSNEVFARCNDIDPNNGTIVSSIETRPLGRSRKSIMASQARVALLAAASILSGMFFGFMFGTLRIEEESMYRMALALQQEAAYTYPVGAFLGGVSAMLYQLIQLPLASDEQIDRILHGGDDL